MLVVVKNADDRSIHHIGMPQQQGFEFCGGNLVSLVLDEFFQPVDDLKWPSLWEVAMSLVFRKPSLSMISSVASGLFR